MRAKVLRFLDPSLQRKGRSPVGLVLFVDPPPDLDLAPVPIPVYPHLDLAPSLANLAFLLTAVSPSALKSA